MTAYAAARAPIAYELRQGKVWPFAWELGPDAFGPRASLAGIAAAEVVVKQRAARGGVRAVWSIAGGQIAIVSDQIVLTAPASATGPLPPGDYDLTLSTGTSAGLADTEVLSGTLTVWEAV